MSLQRFVEIHLKQEVGRIDDGQMLAGGYSVAASATASSTTSPSNR